MPHRHRTAAVGDTCAARMHAGVLLLVLAMVIATDASRPASAPAPDPVAVLGAGERRVHALRGRPRAARLVF